MNCTINNVDSIIASVSFNCQDKDVAGLVSYHFHNADENSTINVTIIDIESIKVDGDLATITHKGNATPVTLPIVSSMSIAFNKPEFSHSLFIFMTQDMETLYTPHKGYTVRFPNSLYDISIQNIKKRAFALDGKMIFLSNPYDRDAWPNRITIVQNTCTDLNQIK